MQLELFPTQVRRAKKTGRWTRLAGKDRKAVIEKLSRLIVRMIRSKGKGASDER